MCIYCTTNNYRKIYENHHGPIPVDEKGRTFHIHHIDGNHNNNDPDNLIAVSNQEHYDIHLSQGDYAACVFLSRHLDTSQEEISRLARESNLKRVADGSHQFLDGEISRKTNQQRLADGTHHFLDSEAQRKKALAACTKRVLDGTHQFLGGDIVRKRVADGTHHLLGGEIQRINAQKRLEAGTHNFLDPVQKSRSAKKGTATRLRNGTHPSQVVRQCYKCGKIGRGPSMLTYHGDNCKAAKLPPCS